MDRADVLLSFVNSAEKLTAEPVVELDFNHSEAATLVPDVRHPVQPRG